MQSPLKVECVSSMVSPMRFRGISNSALRPLGLAQRGSEAARPDDNPHPFPRTLLWWWPARRTHAPASTCPQHARQPAAGATSRAASRTRLCTHAVGRLSAPPATARRRHTTGAIGRDCGRRHSRDCCISDAMPAEQEGARLDDSFSPWTPQGLGHSGDQAATKGTHRGARRLGSCGGRGEGDGDPPPPQRRAGPARPQPSPLSPQ